MGAKMTREVQDANGAKEAKETKGTKEAKRGEGAEEAGEAKKGPLVLSASLSSFKTYWFTLLRLFPCLLSCLRFLGYLGSPASLPLLALECAFDLASNPTRFHT